MKWRNDMDAAPRDGSPVLVYSPGSRRPFKIVEWHSDDEGWEELDPYGDGYGIHEPTRWARLTVPE